MTDEANLNVKKERLNNYKKRFDEIAQSAHEAVEKSNKNVEELRKLVNDDLNSTSNNFLSLKEELESSVNENINILKTEFNLLKSNFTNLNGQLSNTVKNSQNSYSEIEKIKKLIDTIKDDIEKYRVELLESSNDKISIKDDIENSRDTIDSIYNKIIKLNNELFGEERRTSIITKPQADQLDPSKYFIKNGSYIKIEKEATDGVSQRIKKLEEILFEKEKNIDETFKLELDQFKQDFSKIREKVEGLLPGATSAGLASAYETTRKHHKKTEERWGWHFAGAMAGITILGGVSIWLNYGTSDPYDIFKNVLKLIPFELPLIWYAWLASRRIREEARLHEEHLHKWSIARSFEGLSQQARTLDTDEDRKNESQLFGEVVSSYSLNPSNVIDVKGANTPIEKIVEGVINGLAKHQK